MSEAGRFLSRWSRLKQAAAQAPAQETAPPTAAEAETLLAALGPESDFGQFLRQEISEEVRRQAMKKLFADPHFNIMDGLDTYIDDYSVSEPIPEAMLATLSQFKGLFKEEGTSPQEAEKQDGKPEENRDILASAGQNVSTRHTAPTTTTKNQ